MKSVPNTQPETPAKAALKKKAQSRLQKVIIRLRAHTGHDVSLYKHNTLYRRIGRRMGIHPIVNMTAYVRYLQKNPPGLAPRKTKP